MQKLTTIEYNVLMGAIELAKYEIDNDTFIDPYDNTDPEYTNSNAHEALRTAEIKLIDFHAV